MLAHCPQTLALVAAHESGVADDIAEHDRRKLARRIWREGIGRTRHRSLPFDSIGPKTGTPRILLRRLPQREAPPPLSRSTAAPNRHEIGQAPDRLTASATLAAYLPRFPEDRVCKVSARSARFERHKRSVKCRMTSAPESTTASSLKIAAFRSDLHLS